MLNKDQYNQDEYNDYYAQETRGAEISQGGEESGSNKKIAFIFLLLLLIIAVGYFGWKNMSGSTPDSSNATTQTESAEDTTVPKEADLPPKGDSSQADKIAEQVQSIASSDDATGKMNPEDIANIVQMVMMQMNQEKSKATSSTKQSSVNKEDESQDNELMESLSSTEVDSLSSVSDSVDSISQSDNTKQASSSAKPNTYNKVVLADNTANNSNDALSQLSDEISSVIDSEESTPSTNNTYTQSITKEVKTRTREMRYIVVKKGDTLGKIAKRAYGNVMDYKKIYEANPDILRRPDKIYIGQKLRIP